MSRSLLACVVLALLASACGSTVRQTDLAAGGGSAGVPAGAAADGLSVGAGGAGGPAGTTGGLGGSAGGLGSTTGGAAAGGGTTAGGTTAGGGVGTTGGAGGTAGVGGSGGSGGAPAGGSGGGAGGASGPAPAAPAARGRLGPEAGRGFTGDTIRIGVYFDQNGNATAGNLGIGGASFGDTRAQAQLVIDHINAAGGMAGRQVEAVFVGRDTARRLDAAQDQLQQQEACATWTEDEPVFAVVSPLDVYEEFAACLNRNDTPGVLQHLVPYDEQNFADWGRTLYQPSLMNGTRAMRTYVQGLAEQGFFADDAVLGLVSTDAPLYDRIIAQGLRPALAAIGEQVDTQVKLASTDASGAVLQLRAAGVTHVLYVGRTAAFFMIAAASQGYDPIDGLSSLELPAITAQTAPAAQLANSVGVGWWPMMDVRLSEEPPPWPAKQACLEIFTSQGETFADGFAQGVALSYCDALTALRDALDRAPELSTDGLQAGYEAMGDAHQSPSTFQVQVGPGRHDGAQAYRHVRWDTGSGCFRYGDELRPAAS